MYKLKKICLVAVMVIGLCGCTETTADSGAKGSGEQQTTESEAPSNVSATVTGQVTEIYGNYLTLQLAENVRNGMDPGQGGMAGEGKPTGENMPDRASGEVRPMGENMPDRANWEGRPTGENIPDRASGEGMPTGENMPDRASGEGMPTGENMPDKANREGMTGGAIGGNTDLTESIMLGDEIKEYSIPVNTPVYQYGIEMTFSQITAEMYLTLSLDADGNIVEINLLG